MNSEDLSKIIKILSEMMNYDMDVVAEFMQRYIAGDKNAIEAGNKLLLFEIDMIKRLGELDW